LRAADTVPVWLALVLIGVAAVLVREVVVAVRPLRPTLDLGNREAHVLRRVRRLRLLAGLAVVVAWAQREAYEAGSPNWLADAVSFFFLSLAVVLILASWRLARGQML
jgi:hypothetical protein